MTEAKRARAFAELGVFGDETEGKTLGDHLATP